jgi:antitoxin component of RelBE/YafQ-DinJ toxin-antitoxin module
MSVKQEKLISVRVESSTKQVFEKICSSKDLSASQVIRAMIRDYVKQNGQVDLFK